MSLNQLRDWAADLKRDVIALWLAARAPETPILAKIVAGCIAAYALSPVDLIPDFVPVIGLLDDLVIVPLGIALAVRMIPQELMAAFRRDAEIIAQKPVSRTAATVIVMLWLAVITALVFWLFRR